MLELTRAGKNDVAYQLINHRTFPSWGYSIENGATTIWERWDGYVRGRGFQDKGMNSFNHYAIGAVGEWMYRTILGINNDDRHPGYEHFVLRPYPGGGLNWAKGSYNSVRGKIESSWSVVAAALGTSVNPPLTTIARSWAPADDTTLRFQFVAPELTGDAVSRAFAGNVFAIPSTAQLPPRPCAVSGVPAVAANPSSSRTRTAWDSSAGRDGRSRLFPPVGRITRLQLPGMTPGAWRTQNSAISRGRVHQTRDACACPRQCRSAARRRRRRNGWPKT